MIRRLIAALFLALAIAWPMSSARAACDYDVGGSSPFLMTTFEAQLDEEFGCIGTILGGLDVGSDVQAFDADLTIWAGLTPSANAQSLVTAANYAAMMALFPAVIGDSGAGGTKGLVPAPGSGDAAAGKFLKADGTWATAPGAAGGDDVTVNGGAATDPNLNGTTPAAPAGNVNCTWQISSGSVSCYVPKPTESFCVAASDETTNITAATNKVIFHTPYALTLTGVSASVNTAPTGSTIIIDINEDPDAEAGGSSSTTILSTKLSIDASERRSSTAASAAVISDTALAANAEMAIDFDQVGSSTPGKGVKVCLIGHQ